MSETGLVIDCAVAGHLSVAFHHNAVPLIGDIVLDNRGTDAICDVELTIASEPAFAKPLSIRIERIAAGAQHHLRGSDLVLDATFLCNLTEPSRGSLVLTARSGDSVLAERTAGVQLLPPSHWGGSAAAPELLAAFVRPNDAAVDRVLRDAAAKLAAAGKAGDLAGYATGSRRRAWEQAGAIWAALAGRAITGVVPLANFEREGQAVRSPGEVLDGRLATDLDSALLFAACLEQARLNPVMVLAKGRAVVGVWLTAESFAAAVIDDARTLRRRRDRDDFILVDTVLLTQVPPVRFGQAVAQAAGLIDDGGPDTLEFAVDIARARARGIRPLDLARPAPPLPAAADEAATVEVGLDEAPPFADDSAVNAAREAPADRLERWKLKLLDLSPGNRLLDVRDGGTSVALDCPEPALLENLLAAGKRFKLLPQGDKPADSGSGDHDPHQDDARRSAMLEALEQRGELRTHLAEGDLSRRLAELHRATRVAFEESGANILFLAIGFLSWLPKDGTKDGAGQPRRAPLVLVPVALQRPGVRGDFRLAAHEEDARFNPILIEMLRQDFKLDLPELEPELSADDSGIDLVRIFRKMRTRIRDLPGWEVTPDVVLSTFSFARFLMWKELVGRAELLKRSPLAKHLIDTPRHGFGEEGPFPAPDTLDRTLHPSDLFAPLPADSSQLSAVLAAAGGRDFVLLGPPGTGKSQTITNIVSQCLARGRSVLVVSHKAAALEAVQQRMRDIGLGDCCLEVHSAKAQKSAVLAQLRTAWHQRATPATEDWHVTTAVLARLREELNALVQALHRRRPNGMTAYEAFGRAVAARGRFEDIRLDWGDVEHTPEQLAMLRELVQDIRLTLADIGPPSSHPLQGITLAEWSPQWRAELEQAIDTFVAAARALEGRAAAFSASIGLTVADSPAAASALRALGQLLIYKDAVAGVTVLACGPDMVRQTVDELDTLKARAAKLARGLSAVYRPGVYREDLRGLLSDWIAATNSNFIVRVPRQNQVRHRLQPFATSDLTGDLGADLAILIDLKEFSRAADLVCRRLADFGTAVAGLDTDTAAFRLWIEWADFARRVAARLETLSGFEAEQILHHVVLLLTEFHHLFETAGDGRVAAEALNTTLDAMIESHKTLEALAAGGSGRAIPLTAGPSWLADAIVIAERWKNHLHQVQGWCHWINLAAGARTAGLRPFIDAIQRGALDAESTEEAFEAAYARWYAQRIMSEDPVLRAFSAARHADAIARFCAADHQVAELARQAVRGRLAGEVPAPSAVGADPQWDALARELDQRSRRQPLRQLLAAIPNALTRLTPCVMMSPAAIAQYLPADMAPFDVVILDEASQIPAWDAIGAIARGRQTVIVGDPEQLPPTSAGERAIDDIEDGADIEDQESILDACLAAGIPQLRLDWHYRSRHESLIAFSNARYYAGRLVTFPAPLTTDIAVRLIHVPGGVYQRGSDRVNRIEAQAVVDDIVARLGDAAFATRKSSLGVVAFTAEQQRLIESLLDQARRDRPELEPFFDAARWHEPVFVKTLDTVQGDERDVILLSVTVAPDDSGRPPATIAALDKAGGHRRLNVAITRARRELLVFATLKAEHIDLSRTGARGMRDFKHFLEFAERGAGAIAEAFTASDREPASPFEAAVKAALETRGWTVHAEVGVSAFRVELAVVDPDAPDRYLAGIASDGVTYRRAATARDRDRLREEVLAGLGWRIHRVWSAEWWLDAERALDKLHRQLEADVAANRAPPPPPPPVAAADVEAAVEAPTPDAAEVVTSEAAEVPLPEAAEAAIQDAVAAAILEAAVALAEAGDSAPPAGTNDAGAAESASDAAEPEAATNGQASAEAPEPHPEADSALPPHHDRRTPAQAG